MSKARARLTLAIAPVGQPIIPGRPIIPDQVEWLRAEMLKTRAAHGYCSRQLAAEAAPTPLRPDELTAATTSSTLLGWCEGGGEPGGGDGLAAQGAGAEDDGEDDLQFSQDLVQGHPGALAYLYRLGTASGSG